MFGITCFNFTSVRAEETSSETEIDTSLFEYEKSSMFEDWDGTIVIRKYTGDYETVVVPSEIDGMKVKSIKGFSGNNTVKYLTIQEGITEIGDGAFSNCKNLKTICLPDGLESIGSRAFFYCNSLENIILPDGLKIINSIAFSNCSSLTNINIPNSVTMIGNSVFRFCISLKTITIPDSVTYIGEDAFNIRNDKRIIVYGNPDAYIKTYCDFSENVTFSCINHLNIEIDTSIPPTCTKDGKTEGSHCSVCGISIIQQNTIKATGHFWDIGVITIKPTLINKGQKTFTCTVCNQKKIIEIPKSDLPQKGRNITDDKSKSTYKVTNPAAQNGTVEFTNTNLTKSTITIPETIIIDGAVYKVTAISKNAFKNNKKIKKVTVGKNIKTIGSGAFSGCKNLKTIIIKSKQIKTVGKNAFKGIHSKAEIKVPKKKLKSYREIFSKKCQNSTVKITK